MKRALPTALALAGAVLLAPAAQAAVPAIGAASANEVGSESARLEANLNPNGLTTAFSFQYTTLAAFSESGFTGAAATPPASAGAGAVAQEVSAAIVGLAPDTTYRFRLTANNASGTASGKEATFTTSHGLELACEGDECQSLPPVPVDPTLTTLLEGLGNPRVRYHRLNKAPRKPRAKPQGKKHHKPRAKKHRHKKGK